MTMHIVEEELRQALIVKIALETTKRGIKGLNILEFIFITIILLMMRRNHGTENHVVFVACITKWFLSAGRLEWEQERREDVKGLLHIREGRRLTRFARRIIFATIAIEVDIKETHVEGLIQSSVSRTKHPCGN